MTRKAFVDFVEVDRFVVMATALSGDSLIFFFCGTRLKLKGWFCGGELKVTFGDWKIEGNWNRK